MLTHSFLVRPGVELISGMGERLGAALAEHLRHCHGARTLPSVVDNRFHKLNDICVVPIHQQTSVLGTAPIRGVHINADQLVELVKLLGFDHAWPNG